jgi:prepilin-type N-terminal cleavage/methylation domain-containing protein
MISATGKSKGFTLIEIMISISILSVGLIFILQGLTQCISILSISRDNLEASLLAEEKMAEVEIAVKQDTATFSKDTSGEARSGNIELKWQIRLTPDSEYEDLNEVLDTVYWKEGRRSGASVFSTYLTIPHDK